jgi:hypothetical protein
LKFVEWLHRQYGYEYTKPAPTSKLIDNKWRSVLDYGHENQK